jgi:hypothetical protein
MKTSKTHQIAKYICPNCSGGFCIDAIGAAYGLHPTDYDDIFFILLCSQCAPKLHHDTVRLKIRTRFERAITNCDQSTRFAITTRKILTLYNNDIREALENGWPFAKPGHHYDVYELPAGILVIEREAGNAD